MLVLPKNETANNIPSNAGHFLRTEIDSVDFKNENLTTKIRKNKAKKPYLFENNIPNDLETNKTIQILDEISILQPGENAQLAAAKKK